MYLIYFFNNISVSVLENAGTHINNQWFEPHYRTEIIDLEYEFEVEIKFEDFFDFIKPYDFNNWTEDKRLSYKRACKDIFNSDWFRLDDLEEDEDFIDFMKDRYEDDAREQCQEDND